MKRNIVFFITLFISMFFLSIQKTVVAQTVLDTCLVRNWIKSKQHIYFGDTFILFSEKSNVSYMRKYVDTTDIQTGSSIFIDNNKIYMVNGHYLVLVPDTTRYYKHLKIFIRNKKEHTNYYAKDLIKSQQNRKFVFFLPFFISRDSSNYEFVMEYYKGKGGSGASYNISKFSSPTFIKVEVKSHPSNCVIYRMSQYQYDTDEVIDAWAKSNFKVTNKIIDYLNLNYLVVEGRTNIQLDFENSTTIVFIRYGNLISPPQKIKPLLQKSNIIDYTFDVK